MRVRTDENQRDHSASQGVLTARALIGRAAMTVRARALLDSIPPFTRWPEAEQADPEWTARWLAVVINLLKLAAFTTDEASAVVERLEVDRAIAVANGKH